MIAQSNGVSVIGIALRFSGKRIWEGALRVLREKRCKMKKGSTLGRCFRGKLASGRDSLASLKQIALVGKYKIGNIAGQRVFGNSGGWEKA
jgi:hypothetical protein